MPHRLQAAGSLFSIFLGRTGPVRDFDDARAQSPAAYAAFFHAMLDGGVYLPPSPFEAWFLSASHDAAAIARIAAALPAAARAAARALACFPVVRLPGAPSGKLSASGPVGWPSHE